MSFALLAVTGDMKILSPEMTVSSISITCPSRVGGIKSQNTSQLCPFAAATYLPSSVIDIRNRCFMLSDRLSSLLCKIMLLRMSSAQKQ